MTGLLQVRVVALGLTGLASSAAASRPHRPPVKLVSLIWNVHQGNYGGATPAKVVAQLERWVHEHHVQRIALTEAAAMRPALAAWARSNGWRLDQERRLAWNRGRPKPEHGDVAVLLRTEGRGRVVVLRTWVAAMAHLWTVARYQITHAPRRYRRHTLKLYPGQPTDGGGRRHRTSAEHWETANPQNATARAATRASALRFLSRGGSAQIDCDLNSTRDQIEALAAEAAARHRLEHDVDGAQPDWTAVVGGTVTTKVLKTSLSDHDALIASVTLT